MNDYWRQQHGLTPDEKQAFVDKARADEASFRQSLRTTIHSAAENRMLTRVACRGGENEEDGDDASVKNVVCLQSQHTQAGFSVVQCPLLFTYGEYQTH